MQPHVRFCPGLFHEYTYDLIPKVRDLAHIRQPDLRRVHPALCVFLLPADRRGDLSRELSPDTLSAQEAEVRDRPYSGEIILVGAECSGILLHIRRDHLRRLRSLLLKQSTLKISRDKLIEIFMVLCKIFIVLHEIVIERTVPHDLPRRRSIDRIVYIQLCIVYWIRHSERICRKGQIIVPRKDAEDPIFFIEEVIVSGPSQITVQIDCKYLYCKLPEHLIHIHRLLQVFSLGEDLQRPDQPFLVLAVDIKLRISENIIIV